MGLGVRGLGFRIKGLGFRVYDLGFRVCENEFRGFHRGCLYRHMSVSGYIGAMWGLGFRALVRL